MAPKQHGKGVVRGGKIPSRVSPRRSNIADGRSWISITKGHRLGAVRGNENATYHAHGSTSTGKKPKHPMLPTRTSPRKKVIVKLFGPSIDEHHVHSTQQQASIDGMDNPTMQRDHDDAGYINRQEMERDQGIVDHSSQQPIYQHQPADASIIRGRNEDVEATQPIEANFDGQQLEMDTDRAPPTEARSKRGKTRGLAVTQKKLPKEKMAVTCPKHVMRFVGEYSKELTSEIGVVVRSHCPLDVDGWEGIDKDTIKVMIKRIEEWFDLGNEPHTQVALLHQMRRTYRSWRYRLYEKIKKVKDLDDIFEICPDGVFEEEWLCFVYIFMSDEFQERSCKNKRSRDAPRTNHCGGTKSFARIIHEAKTEQEPVSDMEIDRIGLWNDTHYCRKTNKWVDQKSKDIYEQLLSLRESTNLTQDEIFDMVLPQKSCYIPGMGVGPKRLKYRTRQEVTDLQKQVEEYKKREEEAKAREEEAKARMEEYRAKADDVLKQNEELAARISTMEKNMILGLGELNQRFESFERHLPPGWENDDGTQHATGCFS